MNYRLHRLLSVALIVIGAVSICQADATCTYTHFTLPNAVGGTAFGINSYRTTVGQAAFNSGPNQGFIRYSNGTVKYFLAPNSSFTRFTARNDNGVSVGVYIPAGWSITKGFMLNGSTLTVIVHPSAARGTYVAGINKWGTIVGYYLDSAQVPHGFKRYGNGVFVTLNYPGAQGTRILGINDSGAMVGSYDDGGGHHGFVYRNGQWSKLDYPGNTGDGTTTLEGISNGGRIVGISSWEAGFSFIVDGSTFSMLSDPGSDDGPFTTFGYGVAANGLVVGNGTVQNAWNGFIASCQ